MTIKLQVAGSTPVDASPTQVAAIKAGLSLVKADVGLNSVDNTADVDKPISTLTVAALATKITDPGGYAIGAGTTAITHAAHANAVGSVNQPAATTGVFAIASTSGAVARDSFYLRNSGLGAFTASGAIVAPTGYKLTAAKFEVFSADYDAILDTWVSTTVDVGTPTVLILPPTITTQPAAQSVTAPSTATFSVTAATNGGGTLTYQWQRSNDSGGTWANVGTSASTYTTAASTTADSGARFRVTVSNSAGPVTSNVVTLTVAAAAPAPADTRPRFGYAAANATGDATALAALFATTTALTGSASGGRAGTFTTAADVTKYTWLAVLHSAAPSGITVSDGVGPGGFSGATSTGLFSGTDVTPTTVHVSWTNPADGNVWDFYRSNGKASNSPTLTLS